ncbi:hypothetical protein, partial [Escherichia coli]|uniref:hypothetical protein n=1 Tax=Escherichia coli TaxID=562 RepID=UPI003862C60E
YQTTFGKTVAAISAVTDKPIFLAETAAIEGNPSSATPDLKSQWITNVLSTFADSDRIIGFLWFNNVSAVVEGSAQS